MPRKKKKNAGGFNQKGGQPREEVISYEEFFSRVRGDYKPRPSLVPSYGKVDLARVACEGYGRDCPNLENPPKWGIRLWSSVRRDPPDYEGLV